MFFRKLFLPTSMEVTEVMNENLMSKKLCWLIGNGLTEAVTSQFNNEAVPWGTSVNLRSIHASTTG